MDTALIAFKQRIHRPWIRGAANQSWVDPCFGIEADREPDRELNANTPLRVLSESDPLRWIGAFLSAQAGAYPLILANPDWQAQEHQHLYRVIQSAKPPVSDGLILIPTGGSSGQIRWATHTWGTLTASALSFQTFFGLEQVSCLCTLPLHHVSGLMQVVRSLISGGELGFCDWKTLRSGAYTAWDPQGWCISLVPTQLQQILEKPVMAQWLRRFRLVLLGGAPAWEGLLQQAMAEAIPVCLTYGMTETASMIAVVEPERVFAGERRYRILPHAQVTITGSSPGLIQIRASSLMQGYYPDGDPHMTLTTSDLGELDPSGFLQVQGRAGDTILSGGEKIHPLEIESTLMATGWVNDVVLVGIPDPVWGEAAVVIYVPAPGAPLPSTLEAHLRAQISPYKIPKRWIQVQSLPRTAQGKLNRAELKQWVANQGANGLATPS